MSCCPMGHQGRAGPHCVPWKRRQRGKEKPSVTPHYGRVWVQMQSVARKLMTGKNSKNRGAEKKPLFKLGDSSAKPTARSREYAHSTLVKRTQWTVVSRLAVKKKKKRKLSTCQFKKEQSSDPGGVGKK